jgi:hypothetical protein
MNPMTTAAGLLRDLPPGIRKTIYTVLALAGAVLAGLVAAGVDDLGPVTVDRMLQVDAYLSPLMGVVAVANVTPGENDERMLLDFDEDADVSSFEPVGDENDVFAETVH